MQPFRRPLADRARDEQGVALIVALMSMILMMALGTALILTTMTEGKIANNYRDGTEALYAADAAIERVMQDLLTVPDWNTMLGNPNEALTACCSGAVTSSFIDGPASGQRTVPGGKIDLTEATNLVRCGHVTACSDAELKANPNDRPWGWNNPKWQLYAYGPLSDMLPTEGINSQIYVVVWIADDPSENDNLPMKDGDPPPGCDPETDDDCFNPGRGVIAMLAHAYGPNGVHRAVEVTLARTDTTEIERGYTGQRGQDEQNRRARKAAVQTPGKALTKTTLTTGA
jgi:hypothetical protein